MPFSEELLREVVKGLYRRPAYHNMDHLLYPRLRPPLWKRAIFEFAANRGFVRAEPAYYQETALAAVSNLEGLEETWSGLQDEYSRRILALVKAFQILGGRRIHFPVNDRLPAAAQRASGARIRRNTHNAPVLGCLDLFRLDFAEHTISFHGHALNVIDTFLLEQYRYAHPPGIAVQPDDVVIDAGGCWGDTALYFAALAGGRGRVITLECIPENLSILKENLDLNPVLGSRIEVIPKAAGCRSGQKVRFDANGPGSQQAQVCGSSTIEVESITIDGLAASASSVDFIKMDIEGSELDALRGAEETIGRFHPRLAIAVYHRPEDLVEIPRFLRHFGYRLFLDHFTSNAQETILFAV